MNLDVSHVSAFSVRIHFVIILCGLLLSTSIVKRGHPQHIHVYYIEAGMMTTLTLYVHLNNVQMLTFQSFIDLIGILFSYGKNVMSCTLESCL